MNDVSIEDMEKMKKSFDRLWLAIHGAMVDNPRFIDPDFIWQKAGFGPRDNRIRKRRAYKILKRVHWDFLVEVVPMMERESDHIYSTERKCRKCGIQYPPLPDDDGRCPLCISNS